MTYRNSELTALAKDQRCVSCDLHDGTIVWAHSNLQEHGRGFAHKAHDACGMLLCFKCHHELDHGKTMTKEARREFTLTMIVRTHMVLWSRGLVRIA